MKNRFHLYLICLIGVLACDNNDDDLDLTPVVKENATYEVVITEDILYAQGLSHESLNSENATPMPLLMDSYVPQNNSQNRPVLMLIHGGAFVGGTKQQEPLVDMANYYASRGFVVFSIDYRLRDDKGTVPQEWVDASADIYPNNTSQFLAVYPAHRDAKAALRWIVANADTYQINTNYITVGGGSAGATTSIGISVSDLSDYKDELSIDEDSTLTSTNLSQTYEVQTILDFWGSDNAIDILELIYGYQRFDQNSPALFIAHGTEDTTVPLSNALELKSIYEFNNVEFIYYPLQDRGHGAWNAIVNERSLSDLSFEFVANIQNLKIE